MRLDVVTLFPEFVQASADVGIVGRARQRGLFELAVWNPRDFTEDVHRTVDGRPFGGGPGMVMRIEPLAAAIRAAKAAAPGPAPVVYLSPQGPRLTQGRVRELSKRARMVLLCGRYEGIDERLIEREVDEELSTRSLPRRIRSRTACSTARTTRAPSRWATKAYRRS